MKRVLLLVLAAAAFMWVGVMFDFHRAVPASEPEPANSESEADDSPEQAEPPPRFAGVNHPEPGVVGPPRPNVPAHPLPPPELPGRAPEHTPLRMVGQLARRFVRTVQGAPKAVEETQAPAAAKPAPQGDLGRGTRSPEYAKLEHNYADEPRNDGWADAQEQRIRGLLKDPELQSKIALVNCQDTVCRIVLDGVEKNAFADLLQVPGLREETRLSPDSPYSLRGGQLTIYFNPGTPPPGATPP